MGFEDYKHYCEKGPQHQGKQIIMICLNQECEAKRLCCVACIDHLHRKHELISLFRFEEMLGGLVGREEGVKGEVVKLLQDFQAGVEQDLDKQLEAFRKFVDKSRDKLRAIIAAAIDSVNFGFTDREMERVYEELNNETVCRYLELVKEVEGGALKDGAAARKTLESAGVVLERSMSESSKHYSKGMEQANAALQRLKKSFSSHLGSKPRLFSKLNKAACIEVNSQQTVAKRFEGSGSYPVVLLEQPLTQFNNSFTVTLKQQPGNKGCWLGVCVYDIVKNFNFSSCYGIGKGSWAIDQVGASHASAFSWSHHDTNYNSQPKVGFQFQTGDTVTVRVNFQKSTVVFERGTNTYEMPILLDLGAIYPFVGCTHLGDTWAIA